MKQKTADLNTILIANGKPTGDQLLAKQKQERKLDQQRRTQALSGIAPTLTGNRRRNYLRMLRKQGLLTDDNNP